MMPRMRHGTPPRATHPPAAPGAAHPPAAPGQTRTPHTRRRCRPWLLLLLLLLLLLRRTAPCRPRRLLRPASPQGCGSSKRLTAPRLTATAGTAGPQPAGRWRRSPAAAPAAARRAWRVWACVARAACVACVRVSTSLGWTAERCCGVKQSLLCCTSLLATPSPAAPAR
jgi:hypothetical protein